MGSPAAAEEGGEMRGGGWGESGQRRGVRSNQSRRWSQRRQKHDQGRDQAWPGMERRGFPRECYRNHRRRHRRHRHRWSSQRSPRHWHALEI